MPNTTSRRFDGMMIDCDGTLILRDETIAPRVAAAIRMARDRIKISFCTGRPADWTLAHARALGLATPHIVEAGARIVDANGKTLWAKPIEHEVAAQLFHESLMDGFQIFAHTDDGALLTPKMLPKNKGILHLAIYSDNRKKVEALLERIKHDYPMLHGIIAYFDSIDGGSCWTADVTAEGANKQHALLHLAKIERLKLENFIAVGDGYNDFPLLMACGFRVAMGNASEELKAIADYVAPSVDDDGLADVIERFVLKEKRSDGVTPR